MKLLIDTNVVLDIFLKREPFFPDSYAAMKKALENNDHCFISAAAATDIFYILRKHLKSASTAKSKVRDLSPTPSQFPTFAAVRPKNLIRLQKLSSHNRSQVAKYLREYKRPLRLEPRQIFLSSRRTELNFP